MKAPMDPARERAGAAAAPASAVALLADPSPNEATSTNVNPNGSVWVLKVIRIDKYNNNNAFSKLQRAVGHLVVHLRADNFEAVPLLIRSG